MKSINKETHSYVNITLNLTVLNSRCNAVHSLVRNSIRASYGGNWIDRRATINSICEAIRNTK